jgi:hypothetical protein
MHFTVPFCKERKRIGYAPVYHVFNADTETAITVFAYNYELIAGCQQFPHVFKSVVHYARARCFEPAPKTSDTWRYVFMCANDYRIVAFFKGCFHLLIVQIMDQKSHCFHLLY